MTPIPMPIGTVQPSSHSSSPPSGRSVPAAASKTNDSAITRRDPNRLPNPAAGIATAAISSTGSVMSNPPTACEMPRSAVNSGRTGPTMISCVRAPMPARNTARNAASDAVNSRGRPTASVAIEDFLVSVESCTSGSDLGAGRVRGILGRRQEAEFQQARHQQ